MKLQNISNNPLSNTLELKHNPKYKEVHIVIINISLVIFLLVSKL